MEYTHGIHTGKFVFLSSSPSIRAVHIAYDLAEVILQVQNAFRNLLLERTTPTPKPKFNIQLFWLVGSITGDVLTKFMDTMTKVVGGKSFGQHCKIYYKDYIYQ